MAPRPELAQLQSLCEHASTLKRAQQHLALVKSKTGPGSGYNIDTRGASLPAMCAYLASVQLQNDDVSREVAQKASFLNPSAFTNTLEVVRNALGLGDGNSAKTEAPRVKQRADVPDARFEDLAREYDINASVVVGMREAVQELRNSKGRIAKKLLDPQRNNLLVCVIFCWACAAVGQGNKFSKSELRNTYDLTVEDWKVAAKVVNDSCVTARVNLETADASAKVLQTPSSARVSAKQKQASLIAGLLKGNASEDKAIERDADVEKTPTAKAPLPTPSTSTPRGTRYVGLPPPSPSLRKAVAFKDNVTVIARDVSTITSPSKRKASDEEDRMSVDEDETPRKRLFAPASPAKLATKLPMDDEDAEDMFEPSKLNFKKDTEVDVTTTPTKSRTRYVGQHPSLFFLSPSVSPHKTSPTKPVQPVIAPPSPTKELSDTPTKAKAKATTAAKAKATTATKTPSPKKTYKPTRRITRSAARNSFASGFYYEDSDSELDEEEAANPARNLFTQLLHESDAEDDDEKEREDRAAARIRRNAVVAPARRGRLAYVFRDRQALYAQDPVLTAKVRAWKRAQAVSESPVRTATKRKERA